MICAAHRNGTRSTRGSNLRSNTAWKTSAESITPRAIDACHYLNARLVDAFQAGDFILTPTTCGQTPKAGSASGTINGKATDGWVAFTYGINMTRNPAGTVCVGKTGLGLPIGLQIIGNQRDDVGVLKTMCFLEDLLAQPHNAPAGVV